MDVKLEYVYKHLLDWDLNNLQHVHPKAANPTTVLDKYSSFVEYFRVMEPLNLLECYALIAQDIEEFQSCKKATKNPVLFEVEDVRTFDEFTDIMFTVPWTVLEDREVFTSSMVIVSVPRTDTLKCLGKILTVTASKGKKYEDNIMDVWVRTKDHWKAGSRWACTYLSNMVTFERELMALIDMNKVYLGNQILQAQCHPFPLAPESSIKELQKKYGSNKSQAQAVYGSVHALGGISLVQGPPGTGKTKTIVSIICELLSRQTTPIMFCAPSNAAVDELTKRLEAHCKAQGLDYEILRIGFIEKVDPEVAHLTPEAKKQAYKLLLKEEAERLKGLEMEAVRLGKHVDKLFLDKRQLHETVQALYKKMTRENQQKILETKDEIKGVQHCIDLHRPQLAEARKLMWQARNQSKAKIDAFVKKMLKETNVFCSTLSGSASKIVATSSITFTTVIIDEAGQCTEPSILIPLQYGCTKATLVGDPKQLPPTVLSTKAGNFDYDKSLFVRMLDANPRAMHTLDTQYRMHPDISLFPRAQFYDNILKDGPGMFEKTTRPWHTHDHLTPYRFFNVNGVHQVGASHSIFNKAEIEFAHKLFIAALLFGKNGPDKKIQIGIVSPYKLQVEKLKLYFSSVYKKDTLDQHLEINTVDGFQGREKDIIIMSCVRAHPEAHTVGFLADMRRMNVAVTRARNSLWIIGNAATLSVNQKWQALIRNAHDRNMYSEATEFHMKQTKQIKPVKMMKVKTTPMVIPRLTSSVTEALPRLTSEAPFQRHISRRQKPDSCESKIYVETRTRIGSGRKTSKDMLLLVHNLSMSLEPVTLRTI